MMILLPKISQLLHWMSKAENVEPPPTLIKENGNELQAVEQEVEGERQQQHLIPFQEQQQEEVDVETYR